MASNAAISSPSPAVTFWGAAHTVTGSMHLVEANGLKVLLDCGFFQGPREEARRINTHFPFPAREIDAVVLSHAHIDHCGNLPNLFKQGFAGPIYCTPATHDLMAVMLADSAKIQEEDARYLNKNRERGQPRIEPLYDRRDVVRMMHLAQPVQYERTFPVGKGIAFRYVEAGHLLGSAMVHLTIDQNGHERTITFTGDVGRRSLPILRDPQPLPSAELVISECTYGGRVHPPVAELGDELAAVVQRTFERGGKLLVPAFSLGRTQAIVYQLHLLIRNGRLRPMPVFVDSPLASAATNVFRMHPECFDEETALLLQDDPDLFGEKLVHYVPSVEESKTLNFRKDPCILIAASGMCESGRILHHLKHNIEDPRNTILIIGFQAPHTVGRRLVERQPEIRIHDQIFHLKAEVVVMNGFSSHADHNDLLALLTPLKDRAPDIFLVHGEPGPAEALMAGLREHGLDKVTYPAKGTRVEMT